MSSKLGTLTLDLVTKIGNFVGPIKDSEKQVKISFDNMRKHVNTYGAAVAAIGASAVTALAGMAYATAQQASELEKFAFRANTTTQDFQKMAVGAQAYGIEQEKLSDMMKDFNEKLGELTTIGAGGGVDFFEQIAMKTEGSSEAAKKLILDMQKLSGPEALQLYVAKLEEAGVSQQQMSFYLESMASDMTDLYPLLANGGEGMDLYADAAERAGLVMSDNTIEQAKILKEQVYLLDLQLQGAKNQLMAAVIPAFVDIADAFFSGSEQGVQFADIAETIGDGLRYVAKVAIGAATAVQLVGKTIGGLAAAGGAIATGDFAGAKAIGSAMIDDLSATALSAAERMDKVTKSTASSTARQLAQVRQLGTGTKGVNAGLDELAKKQDKATKSSKDNSKVLREQNRLLEERRRIIYDYSSENIQKEMDLEKEIARLRENGMSQYISMAQARYEQEKKLTEMQSAWELVQHRLTQDQKLAYIYDIKEQEIKADAKLTKEQREAKLQSLREQYNIEVNETRIAQQKQLLEVKRNWMSAGDYAQEYYALVREEILNTASYSPEMKNALIRQANSEQGIAENAEREQVWGDYQSRFGSENPYQNDVDLLKEARQQMLISDNEYYQQRALLAATWGEDYLSTTAGALKNVLGEESSYYQAAFAMAKGMAVAKIALNAPETYSNVYNALAGIPYVGPYIAPVVAAGAVAVQLAQAAVVGNVNFTAAPGYADGGFTGYGGKYEPAGIVHKGEGVLTQEEIAALGGPSGFYALRQSIKNGFADGGLALDVPKVLNPSQNPDVKNAIDQAQSTSEQQSTPQSIAINNILDPAIVGDFMGTSSGTKTFMNFIKNNRSSIKAMIA